MLKIFTRRFWKMKLEMLLMSLWPYEDLKDDVRLLEKDTREYIHKIDELEERIEELENKG